MAKVKPIDIIQAISGKVSGDSSTSICCNKVSGKMYTKKNVKSDKPRTKQQKANSQSFKEKAHEVCEWLRANRPSDTNPEGTEAYWSAHKDYVDGHQGTFYSYVWRNLDKLGQNLDKLAI